MQERYIRWWTPHLSRDFEMLAFGPGGGLPLVTFPTSFGRYRQIKDFGLIDAVASFVDSGRVTIYCPDAIDLDSFYNKSIHPADRMRTHLAYENVIVRDVFDIGRRECSTHRVAVCGASLGALCLSGILNAKGIRHWLDDRKWCGHEWKYWRDMLPYYLSKI